jgi:hypothetical protein
MCPTVTSRVFGTNLHSFVNSSKFTIIPLTCNVTRSNDGLEMPRCEKISNFYFVKLVLDLLYFVENQLEMATRESVLLLMALYPINHLFWSFLTPDSTNRHLTLNVLALDKT